MMPMDFWGDNSGFAVDFDLNFRSNSLMIDNVNQKGSPFNLTQLGISTLRVLGGKLDSTNKILSYLTLTGPCED
jgi:hypothetical protein